jgi:NitT/TauT family transport system permease protein
MDIAVLEINLFSRKDLTEAPAPGVWDLVACVFIVFFLFGFTYLIKQMLVPFDIVQNITVDLHPSSLPYYCLRSVIRIFLALIISVIFSFVVGYAAAKSKLAEKIIIPAIDILQSVPPLGFLSLGVWGFLIMFPGSLLGPECAAILVIFTAQVWNMTLSFYQSLRMLPKSSQEVARVLRMSAWQRFWMVEVPYAMPGLLWNAMLSISASWFFVVASEAIDINNQMILLPGVGSYISVAIKTANTEALTWAIVAMFSTILIYDQLIFGPIMLWGNKFKASVAEDHLSSSFVSRLLSRAGFIQFIFKHIKIFFNAILLAPAPRKRAPIKNMSQYWGKSIGDYVRWIMIAIMVYSLSSSMIFCYHFFETYLAIADLKETLYLGAVSAIKILILVIICTVIWVPVGVWIGLRANMARKMQPVIQILAAFPANLFFPFFASIIITYDLNKDIWLSPLMILGTQWYILFNVIAGASSLPDEQKYAVKSLGLTKSLWWRKFILPGICSHLITGVITATGGAWNASIIAEAVNWGSTSLYATGLGAYITYNARHGDNIKLVLGIVVMCFYVLLINRLLWQPLYKFSQKRFSN